MKNILEELGTNNENPAIFYVLGKNLKKTYAKDLAKDALINGHEIGNHSYNHPEFSKINFETAKIEIQETEKLIEMAYQETDTPEKENCSGSFTEMKIEKPKDILKNKNTAFRDGILTQKTGCTLLIKIKWI